MSKKVTIPLCFQALYDYQPGENDVQPMAAWLAVMERAHVNLGLLDDKLCISHLPRFFTSCMKCMLSERPEVQLGTAKTLKVGPYYRINATYFIE